MKHTTGSTYLAIAIVILALSTLYCLRPISSPSKMSAADQLAEQKMEAVNSVCEEEAQTLLKEEIADQPKEELRNPDLTDEAMAKRTGQTVAEIQQAYYKLAKQECVTAELVHQ